MRHLALLLDRFEIGYPGGFRTPPLDCRLAAGERLGLAGESGCGKTSILEHLAGLPRSGATATGVCEVAGRVAYIPQESLINLSPFLPADRQVEHVAGSARSAQFWMGKVGLGDPRKRSSWPHQLSGGERQRVLIAQALATGAGLILADEPAAHLDEETREGILALLDEAAGGAALVVASHQESVFARLRCRICRLTPAPQPEINAQPLAPTGRPAVAVSGLTKRFSHRTLFLGRRHVHAALDGVSMEIRHGETVALMGPSGCGKSTLARCLARRESPSSGTIDYYGGTGVQLVAQEPSNSLNPAMTVAEVMSEASREPVDRILEEVGLGPGWGPRPIAQASEGQRSRVAISRALAAVGGGLLILDESLSSLDEGTAQIILRAIRWRQQQHGLACLLITHDSHLAGTLAHRILRMKEGRISP